jgi:Zn-dependent metalloprotease
MEERRPEPCVCSIVPPHILKHIAAADASEELRSIARHTLERTAAARGQRAAVGILPSLMGVAAGQKRRTVYDARHGTSLPGALVRGEGGAPTHDQEADEAYDGAGATYDFYSQVFNRNSVDNRGLRLDSTVHYQRKFDNAFWNGMQMVYGDGDGVLFGRFTVSVDIIGHELTHGVTQYTANLEYEGQSGALNESMSDVFGSLVKQFKLRQSAAAADWLIGAGLLAPGVHGMALRSMRAPGTAYNDPRLGGRDPQPAHMRDFVQTNEDNGGVHINSGIPNHAFYILATTLGGFAWERAGKIWYAALTRKLSPTADFQACADATFEAAGELFGAHGEQAAVRQAWEAVGIGVSQQILAGGPTLKLHAPLAPQPAAVMPIAPPVTEYPAGPKP